MALGRVLRMRGLPFSATDADIVDFFKAWDVEAVRLCFRQGKPTGEAWARFPSDGACSEALAAKNKQPLGKRYIELFRAKDQDLEGPPPEATAAHRSSTGGVVRMRGLPFSACIGDVATFFRGLHSLDRERVYFAYDGTGRPSGEAYITFACADDFQTAMRLHKHKMGQRYIELFASSNADLQRVAKQRKLRLARGHGGPRVVVAPKDVAAASKTPPVSVQGQLSRGTSSAPSQSSSTEGGAASALDRRLCPRTMTQSFAVTASASMSAPDAACKDMPLSGDLAMYVSGLSLDNGRSIPGAADQMSGATSQASEGAVLKGAKGEKAQSSDHGSDGQSSQAWGGATLGVYNMWADYQILPKPEYDAAPEADSSMGSWESSLHINGMPPRLYTPQAQRLPYQADWLHEYMG